SSEINNKDRVIILSNEVRSMGLEILPPDINYSEVYFAPNDKSIMYGLNAIKNVGEKAAENIVSSRKREGGFKTLFQFVVALDLKCVSRKVLECLIAAGATDSLEGNRAQKFGAVDIAIQYAQSLQAERDNKQVNLFQLGGNTTKSVLSEPSLPDIPPWSDNKRWFKEKELVGMYLTGHPLLQYTTEIETFSNYDFTEPLSRFDKEIVKLGGVISKIKKLLDRKNRQMAFITLESLNGTVEAIAFADIYERFKENIKVDNLVFVQGKLSRRGEKDGRILVESISPLKGLMDRKSKNLNIRLEAEKIKKTDIENLKKLATQCKGDCDLILHIYDKNKNSRMVRSGSVKVSPSKELIDKLRNLHGGKNVWIE
ncbi:MAG: hypothetical protein KAW56_12150, partial [Candidatus Marinimicrobia bacterium]|nr:hypothetical protein [Candidatus Neomarinimicrobiota bacterium]